MSTLARLTASRTASLPVINTCSRGASKNRCSGLTTFCNLLTPPGDLPLFVHYYCCQLLDLGEVDIPEGDHSILVTCFATERNCVATRATPNNLKRNVGIMTVDPDKDTDIDFVMPDR